MQVVLFRVLQIELHVHRPAPLGRQVILCRIHRNTVHPRVEGTVAAKPGNGPVCFDERLLGDIQCQLRVADIPHHQVDDLVLVFHYQQVKRTLVALLDTLDQLAVVRLVRHSAALARVP